jgi:outer membrane protein
MKSRKIVLYIVLLSSFGYANILSLTDAYKLALKHSKELKASEYQIEANKEQLNQAKAQLYPQIYMSAGYGKKEYDGTGTGRLSSYSISFNESIYDASKINRVDITKSKIKLDNLKIEFQRQELAQRVFKIYMEILKSKNKIELYKAYINAKEKRVELLSKKLQLSLGTKTDLLQGQVAYHFSKMDLKREKKLVRINKLKLRHLTGINSIELPTINFNMITDEVISKMREAIENSNKNFISNLQLEQSKMNLDLSAKEIKQAKSAHLPTISLNAQYSKINADAKVSSLENTKSIMLQIQIPIYQGGAVESKIAESKLSYNSAKESLLQVEDEIKEDYEENLATFDASSKSLTLYLESLNSAKAYLNSIEQSFNAGLKSSLDLNDAKSKLYEVKYRFIENIYDMIDAYINLLIITNNFEHLKLVDNIIAVNRENIDLVF